MLTPVPRSPSIVFLDEPSCGVDPASRRAMWNYLASNLSERCIVLTTHSMEEAEALSTTIAIMTDGQLACIGSSQHLMSRFGSGYVLEIKGQDGQEHSIDAFVKGRISSTARLLEQYGSRMRYELANLEETGGLGPIFDILETEKQSGHMPIASYSLGQATLDQIFLRFVKAHQETDEHSEDGSLLHALADTS